MLNSDYLKKSLGTISPPHFMVSQEKCFSCYILFTDPISLSDCLYFLRYWAICILLLCFPGCDVVNFEINLTFLIKRLFYMTKNSRQKFEYLENKKSLGGEIRSIFHYFHRAFSGQNCLRPESAPLIAFCNTFSGCYHCTSLSEYYIINH